MDSALATRSPTPAVAAPGTRRARFAPGTLVTLIAATTVVARATFLGRPMGSDEGGLLLIASQWHPGSSLYGSYWVDRPPLLLDLYLLADRLGGLLALRLIGLLLVVVSVLLAGRIGRLAGGSPAAAALSAAVFLVTPLFGVLEVNGELVAVPFVLGSITLAMGAARAGSGRSRAARLITAGALAAAAALVKQNEIDGLVLIALGAVTFLASTRTRAVRTVLLAMVGAVVAVVVVLLPAAALGTGPVALWDAVVTFRFDAARLIGASAPSTTSTRLHGVLLALLVSGAPLVVLALARRLRTAPGAGALDLRGAAVAVLAWETFSVLGGGSYWLHYLICLVPGLVLATSLVTTPPRHAALDKVRDLPLVGALAIAGISSLVAVTVFLAHPARTDPVITWLQDHHSTGQTGLVTYGHPDYLTASGLTSPYEELWSLPVRVRDPSLTRLQSVLAGPDRPDWVITNSAGSLSGWGIDARSAQAVLDSRYRLAADLGDRRIYLDRTDTTTDLPATPQETP